MRYSDTHKNQTYQRIIEVSSRLFKEYGIDATGIATIMKEATLTNGAFYAHFASKEALVEAVIADQVQQQIESFRKESQDIEGVKAIIELYLSVEHRDHCGTGCPSAALLDEIVRRPHATKKAYSDGMMNLVDSFQAHFPHLDTNQTRALIFALFSLLVGTLQLSRAMTETTTADFVLESGRNAALTLIGSA
jgi:TetR/AcrR family transcriptional repressor of nem operon